MLSPTLPAIDELEITLIGPGYGECVVLHAEGDWIVIDSCIDTRTKRPAALQYLESIGIPAEAVKLIACTHWHDDHIAGISRLLAACKNADFSLSSALSSREFARIVEVFKDWNLRQPIPISSGVAELTAAIEILKADGKRPKLAISNRQIWQSASGNSRLFALSPSDETLINANAQFAALMPHMWTEKTRAKDGSPNHIAVAMHLSVGAHSALLGSDLEEHNNPLIGWSAIVTDLSRPSTKAGFFKVAHHGSATAEHPGIWSDLLSAGPISVMSPFSRTRDPLPTAEQRAAIKHRSRRSFVTADLEQRALKRRGAVARSVAANNLRLAQPNLGWVRSRISMSDPHADWAVELGGDAVEL